MTDQLVFEELRERPEPPQETLRGLTLWQPWAWAIAHGGKRIENRPWRPWPEVLGKLIAIHAAARVDVATEAAAAARPCGASRPSSACPAARPTRGSSG